jgi:hypothetical protein
MRRIVELIPHGADNVGCAADCGHVESRYLVDSAFERVSGNFRFQLRQLKRRELARGSGFCLCWDSELRDCGSFWLFHCLGR